ncbi:MULTISPECIES: stage II sporulation protein M [unclassified Paenibacillus]|uniref:stage II sporulation protein M n=1 Tax=unclassified Paenibacillus TaxID=185978 RepID=UPI0010479BFE|nr:MULTISPECIES: stage II sporulation protein M [unclassified Paenibacillus]NIK72228.1 stage II sporulation protein M [Paenibacillus sp. BK720]TCM87449.1 stage II sporulation protein M [Paenibacillus sp. BK033]
MFRWSEIKAHFKIMNPYIAFGFILFFAGLVVGGTNSAFSDYLEQQLRALGSVAESLDNAENPTLAFMVFIFLNNAIKSIFIIYIGAVFGIIPIFFLVLNGMVVGFLLQHVAETQGTGDMLTVVLGLLPHGIIEIPAIVVACAYGMKFGVLLLKAIGRIVIPGKEAGKSGREIEYFMIRSVPVVVILTVALLVAAIIESTVSVWVSSL